MRKRFFLHHLLLFMVPVMIPVLLLGILSGYIMNRQVRQEIDLRNIEKVSSYALKTEALISDLEQINVSLSHNPTITVRLKSVLSRSSKGISGADYEIVNAIIDLLYSSTNYNVNVASLYVYLTNNSGQFISSTNRFSSLSFFQDIDWYDSYLEHKDKPELVWTEFRNIRPFSFQEDPIRVLTIYRKIFSSGKSDSDGVLVLNVHAQQINRSLADLVANERELLLVAGSDGQLIFHSSKEPVKIVWDGNIATVDGIQFRSYAVPSELQPWEYHLLIPQSDVYVVPNVLSRLTLILVLVTLLVGLMISYYVANRNYGEIRSIVETIDNAKAGKDLPKLPSEHRDVYGFIVRNLIASFLRNDYLSVQLSERRYHMRTLELLALQSQLNPHFLFNTMETIYWRTMALTGKPNEATSMIENLSDILRYALDSEESLVPFQEEVVITRSYLDIQRFRYKDAFTVVWQIPSTVEHVRVMKLLLQPIVENSIYHGIRGLERPAQITIQVKERDSHIRIAVIDNGRGMDAIRLQQLRKELKNPPVEKANHIGLANTSKRLQLQYGSAYGLQVHSHEGLGTCVVMRIPSTRYEK
ncbi:MAG: histidine kinase [Sphaerochaeta sp.]|nr:histidine kinase [Sphaerochaeta sp.]